jgi:hypothetical protein
MYIALHVKYPLFLEIEYSRQILEKHSDTKFHENPSVESRDVPCGGTERRKGGHTDMDEANSRFSQFCEAPKN